MKTHNGKITQLKSDEVFVFGANLQGFHGAGAAGYASFNETGNVWRKYDYGSKPNGWKGCWNEKGKIGPQVGKIGKSYGLVTVTRPGAKRSISAEQIIKNIKALYDLARARPNLTFLVAQGPKGGLNGYSGEEMARFFNAHLIPENIVFQKEFYDLINK